MQVSDIDHKLIAHFSEGAGCCDQRDLQTLDKRQRKVLEFNWHSLMELIPSDCGLITELHAKGCITSRQQMVLRTQSSTQRIESLLELIVRKSLASLDIFISCLPDATRHRMIPLMNYASGEVFVVPSDIVEFFLIIRNCN